MSLLRFGIVGAGMMAREHIRNLKLVDDVMVAALADPVESSLRDSIVEIGRETPTYPDATAMVRDARLDAVIVSSPNFTHRAVLEALFESDCHILCEKPLCTTLEDARWVVERAAARKLHLLDSYGIPIHAACSGIHRRHPCRSRWTLSNAVNSRTSVSLSL